MAPIATVLTMSLICEHHDIHSERVARIDKGKTHSYQICTNHGNTVSSLMAESCDALFTFCDTTLGAKIFLRNFFCNFKFSKKKSLI